MPARSAPSEPPPLESARPARTMNDRILTLDAALRDMALTCPLTDAIEALAERLEGVSAAQANRRRRGTRTAAVPRKRG